MNKVTSIATDPISTEWLAVTKVRDGVHDRYTGRLRDSLPRVTRRIGVLGGTDTARLLDSWREVFLALPDEQARLAVSHPFFNYYWLQLFQACLRADFQFLREWAQHLGRFLVLPASKHGLPAPGPLTVPVGERELRLPGHHAHLLFPERSRPLSVYIEDEGDGVLRHDSVQLPLRFLYADADDAASRKALGAATLITRPVIGGTKIEMDASDAWIGRLMASMNTKPPQPGYPAPDLAPLQGMTAAQRSDVGRAFSFIERVWPELAAEIKAYVVLFVPYRSRYHSSFTEACMMGAVFLSEAMWPFSSIPYTAEHFLHEEAHLRLTLIRETDPLVTSAEEVLYASPWRRDPRPLSGLLQAAFAFARVAAFYRKAYEQTGETFYDTRHAEVASLLAQGMDKVESDPANHFTPRGERLWAQMRAEAARS
jgi:HEXXH motif-containing protein